MATATMGLRRRVTVNNSSSPSNQQSSASTSASTSIGGTSKRNRTENNNSLSHGNLNSLSAGHRDEPPNKKSRAGGIGNSVKTRANSPAVTESTLERGNNVHHGSLGRGRNAGGKFSSRTKSPSISAATTTIPTASSASTPTSSNPSITTASATSVPTSISIPQQQSVQPDISSSFNVLGSNAWPTSTGLPDPQNYTPMSGLNMPGPVQTSLCAAAGLGLPTSIPYMATSMATFVGNATNLGKNSSVSYLDISNMTGGSMNTNSSGNLGPSYPCKSNPAANSVQETNTNNPPIPFSGVMPPSGASSGVYAASSNTHITQQAPNDNGSAAAKSFQNDAMFSAYQPWVIKTYGDLAKTKTITIKKYARILRTLKGEEVNSAENSKFRFWVKSKGFHIGQPAGYDAKPADRIVGRHAVTSPGLDPPLYVPTQLPHNKVRSSRFSSDNFSFLARLPTTFIRRQLSYFLNVIFKLSRIIETRPKNRHFSVCNNRDNPIQTFLFLRTHKFWKIMTTCDNSFWTVIFNYPFIGATRLTTFRLFIVIVVFFFYVNIIVVSWITVVNIERLCLGSCLEGSTSK